ncbi:MAG TPA: hypothetical protein VM689_13950 [Aliidongia sp.]|nr:hypothetical protein [Aliidongia sp.]
MFCECYLRKGLVYLPGLAKATAGFYIGIDPVLIVPIADTDAVLKAMHEIWISGNPIVPTPPPDEPAVLLKYVNAKTWGAFARDALLWTMDEDNGVCKIVGYRKVRHGGYVPDPEQTITLPAGAGFDEMAKRLVEIMQAAAEFKPEQR